MLRLTLAVIHLLALGLGFGAVISRGAALREPLSTISLRRAFRDDSAWGIAAALWITTGLWRLFAGTEKTTSYYMHNTAFYVKMACLALILLLELSPMMTLIKWRTAMGRAGAAQQVATSDGARRIALISYIEAALILCMVIAAAAMARGYGARG